MSARDDGGMARLNRAALALALVLIAALGALWAWSRLRPIESPRWSPERFARVAAPSDSGASERWIVAVHPGCPACTRHLAWLSARLAERERPPALGVLVVDEPARPEALGARADLRAGVWWDSAGVWRRAWGRGRYGETYRFASDGRLLGTTGVDVMPDSAVRR